MSQGVRRLTIATLLFALSCSIGVAATNLVVKHTLAQTVTTPDRKVEGDKLYQQGMQEFRRGEYAKALQTYQRVLEIRQQLGDKAGVGDTLDKIGLVHNGLFQHDKALEVLEEALKIRRELKDGKGEGDTLDNIGAAYLGLEKNEKALEILQQALVIRRQEKDRAGEGITLSRLGIAYSVVKQHEKGLQFLQQALTIHQEVGDKFQEGLTLWRIGQAYFNTNNASDYPRAFEWFNKALAVNKEVGNRAFEGRSLERIARVYFSQNQSEQALKFYQQALPFIQQAGIRQLEAYTFGAIGDTYYIQKDYRKAIEFYNIALPIARELKNQTHELNLLDITGKAYYGLKEYGKAIESFQTALTIAREVKNQEQQYLFIKSIGNIYTDQKQYQQAINFYQQERLALQRANDKKGQSEILLFISATYFQKGELDKAVEIAQQALTIAQETEDKQKQAKILRFIGSTYGMQAKYDQGAEILQKLLATERQNKDESAQIETLKFLSNLCNLKAHNYYTKGLYAQAKVEYLRIVELAQETIALSRNLKKSEIEASTLIYLGNAYTRLQKSQEAEKALQEAVNISRNIKNLELESFAISALHVFYVEQGKQLKSIQILKRDVEIAQEKKKDVNELLTLFNLGGLYIQIGETQKAIEVAQAALSKTQKINVFQLNFYERDAYLESQVNIFQLFMLIYLKRGEVDQAIDFGEQGLKVAQTFDKPEVKITSLLSLADAYRQKENDVKVSELTQQARDIAQEIAQKSKEPNLKAQALQILTQVYIQQKNFPSALESINQALAIAKRLENADLERQYLLILQDIYTAQGNQSKALEVAQQILNLTRGSQWEYQGWTSLIQSNLNAGNTQKAFEIAKEAVSYAQQQQAPSVESTMFSLLAQTQIARGEYQQVIEIEEKLLASQKNIDNYQGRLSGSFVLATVYDILGEYQKVVKFAEPGLLLARERGNLVNQADLSVLLGSAYGSQGEYTKAQKLLEDGLQIARQLKNPRLEASALNALGYFYSNLNQYQKALEITQQSLKVTKEFNLSLIADYPQYTLANIYFSLGDYNKSREFYQNVLINAKKFQNRYYEGLALSNLAINYFAQGEPQKTVEYSQQALVIFQEIKQPRLEAAAYNILSLGYGQLSNDAKAMEASQTFLTFARKVQNPVFEKQALTVIGNIHRKFGRKEQAIATYKLGLSIQTDNQVTGADAYIYAGLARIYRDLNQPNIAIKYYKDSINKIEEVRRGIQGLPRELQKSFLDATVDFERRKVSDVYRELVDLLLSQGREKEALLVRDLLGTQEIREFVAVRGARGEQTQIPQTDFEKKIQARGESIIALGRQISECDRANCPQKTELNNKLQALTEDFTKELQSIEQEIRENRQKDDAFFDPRNKAKIREIVESQPGTVMIYPLVVENRLWLLMYSEGDVVKKQEIPVKREELGKTVLEFRQLMEKCEKLAFCGGEEISKVQAVSQKLYNWLIKPLEAELKANPVKNIVFALDRVTRYVPMSALFDGKQYLIEKYTIYNVLSADLTDMDKSLPTGIEKTSVLGMGLSNPGKVGGLSFRSLPNVPKELNAIVRNSTNKQGIYPGLEFLNNAFDFNTLRDNLTGHKILHLATHGKFVPDKKDGSFLVSGKYEPIQLSEINSLRGLSGIHLVVLSACQTALASPYQDGVEINTLAYYFMNNGAKAVISSLWQVADESTSVLMQRFYSNLAKDGGQNASPRTAEALRQAQLSLLRGNNSITENSEKRGLELMMEPGTPSRNEKPISGYSHPYYWAPFILIGNGL